MGKSRSASIVISYLMKKLNIDYEEAFKIVQSQRKLAQPNNGFK
jgi:protein-tyrosine phosphatase